MSKSAELFTVLVLQIKYRTNSENESDANSFVIII